MTSLTIHIPMHLSELRVWSNEEARFGLLLWHLSLATSQAKLANGPGYPSLAKRNLAPTVEGVCPSAQNRPSHQSSGHRRGEETETLRTGISSGSVCYGAEFQPCCFSPCDLRHQGLVPLALRALPGRVHCSWATQLSRRQIRQEP